MLDGRGPGWGSLRGEETGRRAREPGWGRRGVRRRVRSDLEGAQAAAPRPAAAPARAEAAGKCGGQRGRPWGWLPGLDAAPSPGLLVLRPALPDRPGRQTLPSPASQEGRPAACALRLPPKGPGMPSGLTRLSRPQAASGKPFFPGCCAGQAGPREAEKVEGPSGFPASRQTPEAHPRPRRNPPLRTGQLVHRNRRRTVL